MVLKRSAVRFLVNELDPSCVNFWCGAHMTQCSHLGHVTTHEPALFAERRLMRFEALNH